MSKREKFLIVSGLAVALACVFAQPNVQADGDVDPDDVPEAVMKTIKEHAKGAEIQEIELDDEGGEPRYEAEIIVDGEEVDILVSQTGEFIGYEGDDDEAEESETEVAWDDLPESVQATLSSTIPGAEFESLVREVEDGYVTYEVEYEADGVEAELELTEAGDIMETSTEIDAASLPAAIVERIAKRFPGSEIEEASIVQVTYYEVEIVNAKGEREFEFIANGSIVENDDDDDDED